MLVRAFKSALNAESKRYGSDDDEAERPDAIKIEPALRYEFRSEKPIDQPGKKPSGRNHGERVYG